MTWQLWKVMNDLRKSHIQCLNEKMGTYHLCLSEYMLVQTSYALVKKWVHNKHIGMYALLHFRRLKLFLKKNTNAKLNLPSSKTCRESYFQSIKIISWKTIKCNGQTYVNKHFNDIGRKVHITELKGKENCNLVMKGNNEPLQE